MAEKGRPAGREDWDTLVCFDASLLTPAASPAGTAGFLRAAKGAAPAARSGESLLWQQLGCSVKLVHSVTNIAGLTVRREAAVWVGKVFFQLYAAFLFCFVSPLRPPSIHGRSVFQFYFLFFGILFYYSMSLWCAAVVRADTGAGGFSLERKVAVSSNGCFFSTSFLVFEWAMG